MYILAVCYTAPRLCPFLLSFAHCSMAFFNTIALIKKQSAFFGSMVQGGLLWLLSESWSIRSKCLFCRSLSGLLGLWEVTSLGIGFLVCFYFILYVHQKELVFHYLIRFNCVVLTRRYSHLKLFGLYFLLSGESLFLMITC